VLNRYNNWHASCFYHGRMSNVQAALEQLQKLATSFKTSPLHKLSKQGKSYRPYYNETTATWFRDKVLAKIAEGPVHVQVSPDRNLATIANMLSQGRKFLFDHMDQDGKWFATWEMTNTSRETVGPSKGYKFAAKLDINKALNVVNPCNFYPELTDYLNNLHLSDAGKAVFERTGLALPLADIERLKAMLESYQEFVTYVVESDKVIVINYPTGYTPDGTAL